MTYSQHMSVNDLAEAGTPPEALVEFVGICLDIDCATIVDVSVPSIQREVYEVGWDRFAIGWELDAKRAILDGYRAAVRALRDLESRPPEHQVALQLCAAQARAAEAGRALMAIAGTYRDRHGYARARRGELVDVRATG